MVVRLDLAQLGTAYWEPPHLIQLIEKNVTDELHYGKTFKILPCVHQSIPLISNNSFNINTKALYLVQYSC